MTPALILFALAVLLLLFLLAEDEKRRGVTTIHGDDE